MHGGRIPSYRSSRFLPLVCAIGCALALTPFSAHANGRFPDADQLVIDPSDPTRLVLRATFGMLQSMDGGATWTWLCEEVIGYGGMDDPPIALTANGTLIVGVNGGVAASGDRGCSWAVTGGPAAGYRITDVTVDRTDPSVALAITAEDADGNPDPFVVLSTDDGASWTKLEAEFSPEFIPQTIDTAPSDPARIYVSGNVASASEPPLLYRSDDYGGSWVALPIATDARRAYISAIDPLDADKLYVRLQGDSDDTMSVSEDAGLTWTPLITLTGPMLGFALSPDGERVAVGTKAGGLHVADTVDFAFSEVAPTGVRCLTWSAAGLYVCASEAIDGMTLGLSNDEGATLTPLYHLLDLEPQSCPSGTVTAETCPALWPAVEASLGVGTGGAGGSPPAGGAGGAGGSAAAPEPSGCSCSATTREPRPFGVFLTMGVGAWFCRRRARVGRSTTMDRQS